MGLEKESNINPLAVKARKLDHQARTAESAINVSNGYKVLVKC